jgi:hypothetical protein
VIKSLHGVKKSFDVATDSGYKSGITTDSDMKTILKRTLFLTAAIIVSGLLNVSCETTPADSQGISAPAGQTREGLYQMQDKTFRQLAY